MLTPLLAVTLSACVAPPQSHQAWVLAESDPELRLLRSLPVGFAEGRSEGRVRIVGTPAELDQVAAAGLWVERLGPPVPLPDPYPTASQVAATLGDWAEAWPDRVALRDLGASVEGQTLWAARLGPADAPVLRRLVGGTHGDEASSVALALAIGDALLHQDPGFEGLLDDSALWLVPVANPDGHDAGARFNRNNVDLNRNFSYLWDPNEYAPGTEPFSEPETKALRTLSLGLGVPLGLSLHSGATNLGYVWNHTIDDTVEEDRLVAVGEAYVAACGLEGFYLTNGAAWYTTRGDQNDWSYALQGTLDFTVEVSATKSPDAEELDQVLAAHLSGVAAWLAQPVRLQGQLISADSGRGLAGTLQVDGATEPFLTDPRGHFGRVLETGDWTLTASAPGHETASFDVTLGDDPGAVAWALAPLDLASVRPEPVRLSQGTGTATLTLPGLDPPDVLTLSRPGVDSLNVAFNGTGYPVNPAVLVPGPYTLSAEDWVAPRAVFAGTHDDRVGVTEVTLQPDCVVLEGQGFAEGLEAWALWGIDRSPEPVPVLSRSDARLVLDRSGLPDSGTVDLWLVSQGREVAVVDVLGDPELDTAAPPDTGWAGDTGGTSEGRWGRCSALPRDSAGWSMVVVLLCAALRRPRRLW